MWRSTLVTAVVFLGVQAGRAQDVPYPRPGTVGGPAFPTRGPAIPGLNGPTPVPVTGSTSNWPGMSSLPTATPSAPFITAPAGANPALAAPAFATGPAVPLETTSAFDPDVAELRWLDNRWQLVAGPVFLKDFGRYEAEGREVLRVVRELRLNTMTTLGSPRPILEYWLTNGEAPRGSVAGLRTLPLDTAALKAEQVQGQWCVHDNNRILFNFGQQGDACRQALSVIQRFGFTQIGYIGQVAPVMLVFLANPAVAAPTAPSGVTPAGTPTPGRFPDFRFPHLFGNQNQPASPNPAAAPQPAPPAQMPAVPTLPLSQPPGIPLHQPGAAPPISLQSLRLPGTEAADRVAIDARQLQVRHDGADWKLAMGNHVVANFGPSEADARLAQAALRYYRCTEQVFVGNPRPLFSYFLSNGQAPHGTTYAFNAVSFRPESLSVRLLGTSYVLYDGNQVLMSFGDRMTEAQQSLQAIQQHKFDRLTTFGRGDQSMLMFVRTN